MSNTRYNSSNLPSVLDSERLAEIKSRALAQIRSDSSLSIWQKRAAKRELNSLLEYERQRRRRLMQWQWEDESRERQIQIIEKTCELSNRLTLERQNNLLKIARIRSEIVELKVSSIERIRGLQKKDPRLEEFRRIKHEFAKRKIHKTMQNSMRMEAERDLEDQVIRRKKFQQKVRDVFPEDLVDEVMDRYDRLQYESGKGGDL